MATRPPPTHFAGPTSAPFRAPMIDGQPARWMAAGQVLSTPSVEEAAAGARWHTEVVLPIIAADPRPHVRAILLSPTFVQARMAPIALLRALTSPASPQERMLGDERMVAIRLLSALLPGNKQLRQHALGPDSRWSRVLCDTLLAIQIDVEDDMETERTLDDWACVLRALLFVTQYAGIDEEVPTALGRDGFEQLSRYVVERAPRIVESVYVKLEIIAGDHRPGRRTALCHDICRFLDVLNLKLKQCVR